MKTDILFHIIILPAAALLIFVTGCDSAREPLHSVTLTVTVSDGGMETGGRTKEAGLTTVFTSGDRIGVFAVRDGAIFESVDNICLTAASAGDSLKWTPDGGSVLTYTEGVVYYAYYPYSPTLPARLLLTESGGDTDCFSYIASAWRPLADQSDYASYTASDLMTSRGTVTDGSVSFEMRHMMARVEITFPSRATEIGFDHGLHPLISGYTGTLLINPADPDFRLSGYYTDANGCYRWSIPSGQRPGTANYYTIDPDR